MTLWKQALLARAGRFSEPAGEHGSNTGGAREGGEGGEGEGEGEGAEGGEGEGEGGEGEGEGEGDNKPAGDKKPKLSDSEAKLLKENMKRKDDLKKANDALAAANARLKEFDGLDPAELRALVADKKKAEENQLAAKGEWDTLRERMATEHQTATQSLKDQIAALQSQLSAASGTIDNLTVGQAFANSHFLKEDTVLTPSKARKVYGEHVELVDGEVVVFDKPKGAANRTAIVDQFGNNMAFDEAMKRVVEADTDKDAILKSKVKSGSGSTSKNKPAPAQTTQPAGSVSKIAAGLGALNINGQKIA